MYMSYQIDNYDDLQFNKEKDKLKAIGPLHLVQYIRSSVEILMNMKLEELEQQKKEDKLNESKNSIKSKEGPPIEYEEIMQKLEGEIRNHIRAN